MAEQQKSSWWSSVPGLLTAATGFVAALSGLVAGLNQLGLFRRDEPVARVEVTAAAPRESMPEPEEHTAAVTPATGTAVPAPRPAAPAATPVPRAAAPRPAAPAPEVDAPVASAAPADSVKDTTSARSDERAVVLPARTELELATALRVCAPASGQRRFTALLAAPARGQGGASLPAGTPAVLRIRRGESDRLQVRLDSLLLRGGSVAVHRSTVSLPRGAVTDGCLRAGARVRATLSASVTIPGS
jgi:hypothetical protein